MSELLEQIADNLEGIVEYLRQDALMRKYMARIAMLKQLAGDYRALPRGAKIPEEMQQEDNAVRDLGNEYDFDDVHLYWFRATRWVSEKITEEGEKDDKAGVAEETDAYIREERKGEGCD